jgi:C terminal of Calcineurin-like phosphoesterase/N terminal of Calcineurin-like phosphoesterase/Calcineurin-like phosphoesterase
MNTRILYFFFILMFLGLNANAKDIALGYVYEDLNSNRKFDKSEKGIAGVLVSNGQEVVLTDRDGKYELPLASDDIIFVIKPSGYQVAVNENELPQFYYIHKPSGSPVLNYQGVVPTGKLPKSIDFPLYKSIENDNFEVLLFGDPQTYTDEELSFFDRTIVSELIDVDHVSFGISLGDEVGNNPDLFVPYSNVISKIGIPWYNVMGNHDMNLDAKADSLSDESFESVFGPATYSFNCGKAHFIILDDILSPDPRDGKGYFGGFTQKQLSFLENDLKYVPQDHLVILAFHIPIWEGYMEHDFFRDSDREALFALLKDFPYTLSISAHSHVQINKFLTKKEGWMQDKPHHHLNLGTTCGAWYRGSLDKNSIPQSIMADGTPQGYAYLKVNNNQYEVSYKVARYPVDYQMKVYNPKVIGQSDEYISPIYVNFFMGCENDRVSFRVDQGNWRQMNYTIAFDPSYLHLLHEWDFTRTVIPGKRPSEPRNCYHLWKAFLPSDLSIGEHEIEIRVVDMFGKKHYANSTYQIALP